MSLVQVIIDRTTDLSFTGTWVFDRTEGGTFVPPQGTSFPGTPVDGEIFWRTDENKLYRYDLGTLTWIAVSGAGAAGTIFTWGNTGVGSSVTTRYMTPGFGDTTASTIAQQFRSPIAGTLKNLRIRNNTPAGNGQAIVYTVRVNGTPTSISASMASTASDGSNLINTAALAAGDLIDIAITKAGTIVTSPTNVVCVLQVDAA